MVFELKIRIQHPCSYLEFANLFGKKTMYTYCSRVKDILVIPTEDYEKLDEQKINEGKTFFSNFDSWTVKKAGKNNMILMDCYCLSQKTSISVEVQKKGAVAVYPIKYQAGWEYHKIIAFTNEMVQDLLAYFDGFPLFEILSERTIEDEEIIEQFVSLEDVLNTLTEKQNETLLKAYESGYYAIPRKTKSSKIAQDLQLSRYGFQKTLRTAENTIVKFLAPLLYLKKKNN